MVESGGTAIQRLASLDQFRGYTVFGMLLVNFVGNYDSSPRLLVHTHDYCSYADTIMPQFLFAAGFAMQLSLGRRIRSGESVPWRRVLRRIGGLALVAVVWYSVTEFDSIRTRLTADSPGTLLLFLTKRQWMQTLLHIALTSLWILPVIGRPLRMRVALAVGSAVLHAALSWWFNFAWVNAQPVGIDGGPFGFLTWSLPALTGTWACDVVRSGTPATARRAEDVSPPSPCQSAIRSLVTTGMVLMVIAWCLSVPTTMYNVSEAESAALQDQQLAPDPVVPTSARISHWDRTIVELPFVPPPSHTARKKNYWMMSQRFGTVSYTAFAAGFSLVVFGLFHHCCDRRGWQSSMFRTLGTNALAAYILHDVAGWVIGPWVPETAGIGLVVAAFVPFLGLVYGGCRLLEWRGWLIRL